MGLPNSSEVREFLKGVARLSVDTEIDAGCCLLGLPNSGVEPLRPPPPNSGKGGGGCWVMAFWRGAGLALRGLGLDTKNPLSPLDLLYSLVGVGGVI